MPGNCPKKFGIYRTTKDIADKENLFFALADVIAQLIYHRYIGIISYVINMKKFEFKEQTAGTKSLSKRKIHKVC